MTKKKIIRAEDITEKEILSFYEKIIPLQYNPTEIRPHKQLHRLINTYVHSRIMSFYLDESTQRNGEEKFSVIGTAWDIPGSIQTLSGVEISYLSPSNNDDTFEKEITELYLETVSRRKSAFPDESHEYPFYRLVSLDTPKLCLYFIRVGNDNAYSTEEKAILDKLAPHLFILYRAVLASHINTPTVEYFKVFGNICTRIAKDYNLSEGETRYIPHIIFGLTNDEIAEKLFVSVPAVKKNIKHIFKKTDTKNRVDFISHFFTSPEHVKL